MAKNQTKKPKNEKKKSKYPMRSKKLLTFKGRSGYPMLHKDEKTGRIFIMTRKKSGGVERTYLTKSLGIPKELQKHPSVKRLKTKNPTKAAPKKRKKSTKEKAGIGIGTLLGVGIAGYLLYRMIKRTSSATGAETKPQKKILSYREWREQRRQKRR